jgi:hypothetical protein
MLGTDSKIQSENYDMALYRLWRLLSMKCST